MAASILIVEDDDDIREVLALLLQGEGYTVQTAPEGQRAYELLAAGPPPAVILLDLMMPGMNGWDFLAQLPEHPSLAAIPVVVLSATTHTAPPGACAFLPKPIDLEALLKIVKRYTHGGSAAP